MSIRRTAFAAVGAAALVACSRNPATGHNQLMLVSESQEIAMGQQADSEVIATIGLYPDSSLQRYIQQFGARLAANSERPNLHWTFRVVDDPAVNAFAIPGGFIYVTRGIMAHLNSEAELASVVGHEIGHVAARHTAAEMSRQQVIGLGLAIGSAANSTVAQYAGLASQALGVLYLKFSRDHESQADQLGLRYMSRARYDVHQMPAIFTMLERQSQAAGGSRLPEWLETHPDPGHRREAIEAQIAALPRDQASGTTVNRDSYERRLDGIIFGANPRDGYFRGSEFLHPTLRFKIDFPRGWTTANGAQAVQAVSPQQNAALELTLAQGVGDAETAARQFLGQQGVQAGTASKVSINGLPAVVSEFAAPTEQGNVRGTVAFVQQGNTVYRIIGYAPEAAWAANQMAAENAIRSFATLNDPAALNVQPQRVDIVTVGQATTITEMLRERASPASAAQLALLNQVEPDTRLAAGSLVKWIVGQPTPQQASNK